MKHPQPARTPSDPFHAVRRLGLALPDVAASTKYDGSPLLTLGGAFMAGLATHTSAEPATLVVRVDVEQREALLEEAPDTYYLTDYYRPHPNGPARERLIIHDACRQSRFIRELYLTVFGKAEGTRLR